MFEIVGGMHCVFARNLGNYENHMVVIKRLRAAHEANWLASIRLASKTLALQLTGLGGHFATKVCNQQGCSNPSTTSLKTTRTRRAHTVCQQNGHLGRRSPVPVEGALSRIGRRTLALALTTSNPSASKTRYPVGRTVGPEYAQQV